MTDLGDETKKIHNEPEEFDSATKELFKKKKTFRGLSKPEIPQ